MDKPSGEDSNSISAIAGEPRTVDNQSDEDHFSLSARAERRGTSDNVSNLDRSSTSSSLERRDTVDVMLAVDPSYHFPTLGPITMDNISVRELPSEPRAADNVGDRSIFSRAERMLEYANTVRAHDYETRRQVRPTNRDLVGSIGNFFISSYFRRWSALMSGTAMTIGGIAGGAYALNHYTNPWGWASIWFSTGAAGLYVTCKSLPTVCLDDDRPRGYYNVLADTARFRRPDNFSPRTEPSPSASLQSYRTESHEPRSTVSLRSVATDSDSPFGTTASISSFRSAAVSSLTSFYSAASSMAAGGGASSDSSREQQPKTEGRRSGRRFRSISESCVHGMTHQDALVELEFEELPPYSPEEWEECNRQKAEGKRLRSFEQKSLSD